MIRRTGSALLCLLLAALMAWGIMPREAQAAQKNAFVLVVEDALLHG